MNEDENPQNPSGPQPGLADPAGAEGGDAPEQSVADIRTQRLAKLERLRAAGVNVYPYRFDRDRTLAELRAEFGALARARRPRSRCTSPAASCSSAAGRLTFITLRDRDAEVQLFVSQGVLGKDAFIEFNDLETGVTGSVSSARHGHEEGRAVGER